MKSINPVSQPSTQPNIQSNIVPFTSEQFAPKFRNETQLHFSQDSVWSHFWNRLYKFLTPRSEPQIVQKTTPDGNQYYQVYDPVTGRSQAFSSELETRIWLDRRFYQ